MEGCLEFGISAVVLFGFVIIVGIINSYFGVRFFRKLCTGLSGSFDEKTVNDRGKVHQFHTEVRNRKVIISLGAPPGRTKVSELFEIRIQAKQNFWLRMNRELTPEEDSYEIQSGIQWIDDKYLINTNQQDAAKAFLQKASVQELLGRFLSIFDKLEILHGEICFSLNDPRKSHPNQPLSQGLLDQLLSFTEVYEDHRLIEVQIAMSKASHRCPYCRTSLDEASGENIVQCPDCSTRLHEACWNENLQCTTWGCRSTRTERNVQME